MATEMGGARAVWFPRARTVEVRPASLAPTGSKDVRIRAVASGLSAGTEMLVYRGQVPPDLELDLPTLEGKFDFPIKYGYATVGRVVGVGSDVRGLRPGTPVFVHHPHQTEFVVPASMPVPLPADLPAECGVFLANVETAINVVLDAHPRLGEHVVIFGQGVVGLLITQLVRRAGAATVVAVDPVAARRTLAEAVGAGLSLTPDLALPEAIRKATGGRSADVVIEASGNPAALAQALDCVASEGTIVVCSWYGTKPVTLPLGGAFHRGRLRLVSSQVGSIGPELRARWDRDRRATLAASLLPELQLTELITHRFPFDRAAEAYETVERRPEDTVQVILNYDES